MTRRNTSPSNSGSLRRTVGDGVALVAIWSWIVVRVALDSVSSGVDRVAAVVVSRASDSESIDPRSLEWALDEVMGGVL